MATQDNASRGRWSELCNNMKGLADATVNDNETLRAAIKALEHDIGIWGRVSAAGDDEQGMLALCVVDGSRTMFSTPYLHRGFVGGRLAAERLLSCIQERLDSSKNGISSLGELNITISVYCAKASLVESLEGRGVCEPGVIDAFLAGFSQASSLISIVDVIDQESVDDKILTHLRTFAVLPEVTHVFFASGYESPMTSISETLEVIGARDKLYFLRSSGSSAPVTVALESIDTQDALAEESPVEDKSPSENEQISPLRLRSPLPTSSSPTSAFSSPITSLKQRPIINPNMPLDRQNPHPCNEFYLMGECPKADRCRYSHEYELTEEQLKELGKIAKALPCSYVNNGQECWFGAKCAWGHTCPQGIKCRYLSKGTCRFKAAGMHRSQFSRTSPTWGPGAREKAI
ncbi:unnamed protein product [Peniophora sp. CBMAI 1063]|nr:unnamed protein product [Peniophora sp. CBMAI 1063]